MPKKKSIDQMRADYEALKRSLLEVGLVQVGSVNKRMDRRPDAKGVMRERGPYWQWTRKEGGNTKTVNLSAAQVRLWKRAIAEHRRLERTMRAMRALSLRILRKMTGDERG